MTDKTKDKPAPTPAPGEARIVPDIGVARVETAEEVRQTKEGEKAPAAPYDGDPKEAHALAVEQSQRVAQAPAKPDNLPSVGMPPAEGEEEELYPIRLLYDWWDGQGIRHPRDSTIDVPLNEMEKLMAEGKAEYAGKLTPSKKK